MSRGIPLKSIPRRLNRKEAQNALDSVWPRVIFDAVSTPMAILDPKGILISPNLAWKESAARNRIPGSGCKDGGNYVTACTRAKGKFSSSPSAISKGLKRVLAGQLKDFEIDYSSGSGREREWFRLLASSTNGNRARGAAVMHINITGHKRAELLQQEFSNLGQKLSSAATIKKAAWIIVDVSQKLIGWDAFVLDLYSPETNTVRPVLTLDRVNGKMTEVRSVNPSYDKPTARTQRAINEGGFLILRKKSEPKPKDLVPFGNIERLSASIIFVPIRNRTRVTGVLSIQSYTYNAYDNDDLGVLQALADHCGGALDRISAEEERKKAQAQLKKSHEHLRALAGRVQSVKEEECFRISREIHDELGQALTGFKFDLSWLDKKLAHSLDPESLTTVQTKVKSMVQFANHTIEAIRRISRELRPRVLDDLGLIAAIEWQAQEFEKRTGIRCEMSNVGNGWKLPPSTATAVFRIFQEVLTNVARHAKASKATITFARNENHALLKVADNGRGITRAEMSSTRSLGLLNIRERAQFFGGTVEIRGEKNQGTTVMVRIPIGSKNPL